MMSKKVSTALTASIANANTGQATCRPDNEPSRSSPKNEKIPTSEASKTMYASVVRKPAPRPMMRPSPCET